MTESANITDRVTIGQYLKIRTGGGVTHFLYITGRIMVPEPYPPVIVMEHFDDQK